ncbi:MAG: SPOR domain-containing protein [Methylotenera sp.]|nr:SPOR domain-containing protein [Methylotenera sp.]MSQ00157.1 SPOR domain-containing protein [Methylotenera sp.]
MSRDYKPSPERSRNASKGSPFLTGLLVGILLGVAASLGVVMFIKGGESPFANQSTTEVARSVAEKMKDQTKASAEEASTNAQQAPVTENPVGDNAEETRFDFYTILPGSESKVSEEEEIKIKEAAPEPSAQKSYFLQVGAFQTGEEADNMKARLALQGFEAIVQTATIPDKGVWHRVRVGPLNNLDQINKTKSDLVKNGFKADLIKVNADNQ